MNRATKTITQLNDATDALFPVNLNANGYVNIMIDFDTLVGEIELQRSSDGGSNWYTVDTFLASSQTWFKDESRGMSYRLICTDFTSGSATVELNG